MKRRRTQFADSLINNIDINNQYIIQLSELALSMFEWKNLPKTVDPRFLEMTLYLNGSIVFFKDEDLGYLALPVTFNGSWNVYDIPVRRRAYATNGYQRELTIDNSVIIYNNMLRTNSVNLTRIFSKRLSQLDQIIDVNANAQKTPILILCDEKERLSMNNMYMQYSGNQPVIYGTKSLDPKTFTVLKTDSPYNCDKLYQLKTQIWNEALTYLGISNINITKKERLITDEVTRNQGGTIANRYSRLNVRQQACKEINEMFGLNISVDYRADFNDELIDDEMNSIDNIVGGEDNG